MSISVLSPDRITMSQRERDVLTIMHAVLRGERTQAEAARLLDKSTRQVRRLQRRLQAGGDAALVHRLRGQPSNHQPDPKLRQAVLAAYRQRYADFGPTFASEKLAHEGLHVGAQTLRRWLIAEGLWQRRRRREAHRSHRPRRACFGELVQMDASIHDWLEGRGEEVVLISMVDDATSRTLARFYPAGTVEAHCTRFPEILRTTTLNTLRERTAAAYGKLSEGEERQYLLGGKLSEGEEKRERQYLLGYLPRRPGAADGRSAAGGGSALAACPVIPSIPWPFGLSTWQSSMASRPSPGARGRGSSLRPKSRGCCCRAVIPSAPMLSPRRSWVTTRWPSPRPAHSPEIITPNS